MFSNMHFSEIDAHMAKCFKSNKFNYPVSNDFEDEGLKEVCNKISILLETTGGILFSLEGFQKMPFTIKNFTQGDLHSTGGIQMAFLGGCNSTGEIQLSLQGV